MSGAGLTFAFSGQDPTNSNNPEQVSGAAAFALTSFGTTPNGTPVTMSGTVAAPVQINGNNFDYAVGMVAAGLNPGAGTAGLSSSNSFNNELLAEVQAGIVSFNRLTTIDTIAGVPVARVDSNGNPNRFDGQARFVTTSSCGTGCTTANSSHANATFSIRPQDFTGVLTGLTPATITNFDRDPQTGISWGRYADGNVAIFDRIGGPGAFTPVAANVNTQNWHFINSGQQNGAVLLPTTGTFNYTFAGGTQPTDNLGNVGALTAQSLTANFTAQTVSASVTSSFTAPSNTGTWVATTGTATNSFIPIQLGVFFQGETGNTASNLTATVNGSSAGVNGRLTGIFAGKSGQGVMVGYSVNQGGTIGTGTLGTTISGVAAFRR